MKACLAFKYAFVKLNACCGEFSVDMWRMRLYWKLRRVSDLLQRWSSSWKYHFVRCCKLLNENNGYKRNIKMSSGCIDELKKKGSLESNHSSSNLRMQTQLNRKLKTTSGFLLVKRILFNITLCFRITFNHILCSVSLISVCSASNYGVMLFNFISWKTSPAYFYSLNV